MQCDSLTIALRMRNANDAKDAESDPISPAKAAPTLTEVIACRYELA